MKPSFRFEKSAAARGFRFIAGVDEAGRGPLAGPVVAAACILPRQFSAKGIDDSKKLSPAQREILFEALVQDQEVVYGVGIVEAERIDQVNILRATFEAMLLALAALRLAPDYFLVDGLFLPPATIPGEPIVKGDSLSQSIAAASIIAKVIRDQLMMQYHTVWPLYGFDQHKGYPTRQHIQKIKEAGPCPIHRKSFKTKGN